MPQDGEIVGAIVEPVSGLILVHGHVEHPMERVLDGPYRRPLII
jgi:hypothetical protein